jgi:phosphatidylglycerol---prolipoprotein diacylglyceryl transferase
MRPVLIEIGGVPVYSHGVFLVLGLTVGFALLLSEARRRQWPRGEVAPIALAALVGGLIGARWSILFLNGPETARTILNFYALFDPRIGPGSILGAVTGAYIAGYIASRIIGKAGCACDAFAPAMALAMVIGRFGCYLAGEDGLGKVTTGPWGVRLPGAAVAVHPTPLYDAAFNLVWFGVLVLLRDHPSMQNGNLLKFGVGGYAAFRFGVEFLRNNRVLALGLTPHQFVCLAILGALGAYYGWRWAKRSAGNTLIESP